MNRLLPSYSGSDPSIQGNHRAAQRVRLGHDFAGRRDDDAAAHHVEAFFTPRLGDAHDPGSVGAICAPPTVRVRNRLSSLGEKISTLDRIKIDPTHFMRWIDFVNPIYINKVEQIHTLVGSPKAIPNKPDML